MIFNEMKTFTLSELCEIKYGKDHKKLLEGSVPVYGTGGIMRYADSYLYDKESVLIPRKGTLSNLYYIKGKFWTVDTLFWTKINEKLIMPKFLYYKLLTINFSEMNVGSAVPSLTTELLNRIQLVIPSLEIQKEIANILSSLDDKIELNNKINKNLEELAQTLYKRWFVDFEFPNENGEPYKSSGGEMVDSEHGLIPDGWKIREQGDYFPVITGKKNANYATIDGEYKFFTCSRDVFQAPNYSFDGSSILVAGNGDFNVKYYKGKFEAYQRTYVLIPYNDKLTGFLYFMIKENLSEITSGHRGSVIRFITKGDLENFKIILPEDKILEKMSIIFENLINKIEKNKLENETLSKTRDLLLPKLMSGEIRIPLKE